MFLYISNETDLLVAWFFVSDGTLFFSGEKEKVERKPLYAYLISPPINVQIAEIEKTCPVRNVLIFSGLRTVSNFFRFLHKMGPGDIQ